MLSIELERISVHC